jgi:inorganic pyrophosphatase
MHKERLMEVKNVFIEIPKNSLVKYEIDKETGQLVVDRFMHTAMSYPFNYGFLPNTHAQDGDAVDVMVISTHPVQAGCMLPSRIIGVLEMEDEAGPDNKVIAVPAKNVDPFYAHVNDINDIDEATKKIIKHFFEHYKSIEVGKWTKVKGFLDKACALAEIEESCL